MPGQGWLEHAALFLGMWTLMMIAMMSPALTPLLSRYQHAVRLAASARRPGTVGLLACVTAGYFGVWMLLGAALLPLGVALSALTASDPRIAGAMPPLSAVVVLVAGAAQFSRWKERQLACCRGAADGHHDPQPDYRAAWRHGIHLGKRCVYCCAPLTAVLLVIGVMDLLAMALVTIAISAERLTSERSFAARFNGVVILAMGAWMLSGLL